MAAVIAAVLTLLAAPFTEAIAVAPAEPLSTYAYAGHHHPALVTGVVTERRPPVHHVLTTHDAGDRWSPGAFACSEERPSPTVTTYDDPARLVKVARATSTTVTQAGREDTQIGGRMYIRHVVDRLQPSGLGAPAGATGAGRSISPNWGLPRRR